MRFLGDLFSNYRGWATNAAADNEIRLAAVAIRVDLAGSEVDFLTIYLDPTAVPVEAGADRLVGRDHRQNVVHANIGTSLVTTEIGSVRGALTDIATSRVTANARATPVSRDSTGLRAAIRVDAAAIRGRTCQSP